MKNQMRSTARIVCALILVATVVSKMGHTADQVQCPAKIEVKEQIAAAVAGWTPASDDLPHRFAGLTFFDGKPGEKASLAPDSESKANGKLVSTWKFVSGDRGLWVACHYAGTAVTLTRELPASVRACTVTFNPRQSVGGLPLIEKIDCK